MLPEGLRSQLPGRPGSAGGADIRREDAGILGPQVASGAQNGAVAKARRRPLVEEGAAFLGAGDSAEPLRLGERGGPRDRLSEDDLACEHRPAWPYHPPELTEDR